jgi:hypothetical protein
MAKVSGGGMPHIESIRPSEPVASKDTVLSPDLKDLPLHAKEKTSDPKVKAELNQTNPLTRRK